MSELTAEIPEVHRFDKERLSSYLNGHIEDFAGLAEVRKFQGGASNPTFLLTENAPGKRRFVLRKKPPGKLLASAHQVDREYRIMKALAPMGVPVPRMRVLCQDDSIIG
ncbi:MAG: phosphotransferase, partial [Alphaproteobacteria bacterium]|nr:phosphotransferase [Alphaproteobacteria bacterium]